MMQTLKIRIPPANTERRSNRAIQRTRPASFVLEAATRAHGTKSPQRTYHSTSRLKTPLVPVRGFCFFVDGIPLPVARQGTTVTRKSPPRDLAHIVNAALA
jgi:hypothetical protein